ncbi:calcium-binding protein [Pseudooceanicola nanhaiensis]|uniref:calcium-binding protein n=1 Tax=Pseudooceanicola nanhaiensis TaxID=375761 RepID=UPI0021E6269D|nr:calcium-binding protein [Pseudooceanicola nanhaiensis]
MTHLLWRGTSATGREALDIGISQIYVSNMGGSLYAYASTGPGGGLSAWRLSEGRAPELIDTEVFRGLSVPLGCDALVPVALPDAPFLAVAGAGGAMAGVRLQSDGRMSGLSQVDLAGGPTAATALACDGDGHLFATDANGRLTTLATSAEGYRATGSVAGTGEVSAMLTVEVDGQAWLYTAGSGVQGVVGYRLSGTGRPEATSSAAAASGLGVADPMELQAVEVMGRDYLLLAGGGSSSISVIEIGPGGDLLVRDHVIDSLNSRFSHVQTLETVSADGHVFVLAAGADDGISLFRLLPGGRLLHLDSLAAEAGADLSDIRTLAAARVGAEIQVLAARESAEGLTRLSVPVGDLGVQRSTGGAGGQLRGGDGDDVLTGGGGDDRLDGGAGDDILLDGAGADTLIGGAGADVFVMVQDGARDRIEGFNPGEDRLDLSGYWMLYDPERVEVTPVSGGALLSWGQEVINLRSVDGRALDPAAVRAAILRGPDRPPMAIARETLGSDDADSLTGFWASDVLAGFGGSDRLDGGEGDDSLYGGDQDDLLLGGGGDDAVWGGNGADLAFLGTGHDIFHDNAQGGPFGADTVWAGQGHDTVEGGAGADVFGGEWGDDLLLGRRGNDRLFGGDGNDVLDGGDDEDLLQGGAGNDRLLGGNHADRLEGGDGHDTVVGGNGADLAFLGTGNDIFYDNGQGGVFGADTVWGGQGHDTVEGGAGADVFGGEWGDDLLLGRRGNDTLFGGDGNDVLDGGDEEDHLYGGNGNDRLFGGNHADRIEAGAGNDTVVGGNGADLAFLGTGNDIFYDNAQGDVFGRDTVWAGQGNDTIEGGAGADVFGGEGGDDVLRGGEGADVLIGGPGADRLTGGGGADAFVFRAGDGRDVIWDFTPGEDVLRFDDGLWSGSLGPGQVIARFAHDTAEGILFDFGEETLLLEGLHRPGDLTGDIEIF